MPIPLKKGSHVKNCKHDACEIPDLRPLSLNLEVTLSTQQLFRKSNFLPSRSDSPNSILLGTTPEVRPYTLQITQT